MQNTDSDVFFQDWLQIDPVDVFQASLLSYDFPAQMDVNSGPEVPEVKHPLKLIGGRCSHETAAYRGFSSPGGGCNAKRHHRLLGCFAVLTFSSPRFCLKEVLPSSSFNSKHHKHMSWSWSAFLQRPVNAAQGS